jgi:hypothetical protein
VIEGPRKRIFVGISAIDVEFQGVLKVLFIQNHPQDFLIVENAEKLVVFGVEWQLSLRDTLVSLLPSRSHQGVSLEFLIRGTRPIPQRDLGIISMPNKQHPIQEDTAS